MPSIFEKEKLPQIPTTDTRQLPTDAFGKDLPQKQGSLTGLERVNPENYYSANKDAGSVLGTDLEQSLWGMFNKAGAGGGKVGKAPQVGLADRSAEFMGFQGDVTNYMKNLMSSAADTAEGMFGQSAYNQTTADNDIIIQKEVEKLQEQFGGNVNHPAFIKARNELMQASRMYNSRVLTDFMQKKAQYGLEVGEMVKNYYDVYSTREEEQQKLKLAKDQFNAEMQMKRMQMASSAASAGFGQQMAALAAIAANRKFEAEIGLQASTTELDARVANYVTQLNIDLENRKLAQAERTAKAQQTNNIISGIISGVSTILGKVIPG